MPKTDKFTYCLKHNPCQICGRSDGSCREIEHKGIAFCIESSGSYRKGDLLNGYRYIGLKGQHDMWVIDSQYQGNDSKSTVDFKAIREERKKKAEEEHKALIDSLLDDKTKDKYFRIYLNKFSLSQKHYEELKNKRGLTDEEIKSGLYRSVRTIPFIEGFPNNFPGVKINDYGNKVIAVAKGWAAPIFNADGLITGFQIRSDNPVKSKYCWIENCKNKKGEMPLAVYRPKVDYTNEVQTIDLASVLLVEGTSVKPLTACKRLNAPSIGAAGGNHAASSETLKETLDAFTKENDDEKPVIKIIPDAGDVKNEGVTGNIRRKVSIVRNLGYTVKVLWWNQLTKEHEDIDEDVDLNQIKEISPDEFFKICNREIKKRKASEQLVSLTGLGFPATEVNERYVSDIGIELKPGVVTLVSSPMGTGKTHWLQLIVDIFTKNNDGKIRFTGYRNGLLRQTANEISKTTNGRISPILANDLDKNEQTPEFIAGLQAVSLCVDSILKLDPESLTGGLIILDEWEAILNHLLKGHTCAKNRANIISHFRRCIKHCLETGGSVLAMEANITDLSVEWFKNENIEVYVNKYQVSSWDVTIAGGSSTGLTSKIINALNEGLNVVVPTDSQAYAEKLENLILKLVPGCEVLRIDRESITECPELHEFMESPDKYLATYKPQCLIYSPTFESGGDISSQYFDVMFGYMTALNTRSQSQMLGRVRDASIKREIWVNDCDKTVNARYFDYKNIFNDMFIAAEKIDEAVNLVKTIDAEDNLGQVKTGWYAKLGKAKDDSESDLHKLFMMASKFEARDNIYRSDMRNNLIKYLRDQGHNVTVTEYEKVDEIKDLTKQTKEEIQLKNAVRFYEADISEMDKVTAQSIMQSHSAKKAERVKAEKFMLMERLPGFELTLDKVEACFIKDRGELYRKTLIWWNALNLDVAMRLELNQWKYHAKKDEVWLSDIKHYGLVSTLLNVLEIPQLALDTAREYSDDDAETIKLKQRILKKREDIQLLLGITIGYAMTPIKILKKLFGKIGVELQSRRTGREQKRVYQVKSSLEAYDYQLEILAALDRHKANVLADDPEAYTLPEPEQIAETLDVVLNGVNILNNSQKDTTSSSGFDIAWNEEPGFKVGDQVMWFSEASQRYYPGKIQSFINDDIHVEVGIYHQGKLYSTGFAKIATLRPIAESVDVVSNSDKLINNSQKDTTLVAAS